MMIRSQRHAFHVVRMSTWIERHAPRTCILVPYNQFVMVQVLDSERYNLICHAHVVLCIKCTYTWHTFCFWWSAKASVVGSFDSCGKFRGLWLDGCIWHVQLFMFLLWTCLRVSHCILKQNFSPQERSIQHQRFWFWWFLMSCILILCSDTSWALALRTHWILQQLIIYYPSRI